MLNRPEHLIEELEKQRIPIIRPLVKKDVTVRKQLEKLPGG